MVLISRESRHGLGPLPQEITGCNQGVCWGCKFTWGLMEETSASKLAWLFVAFSSLRVVGLCTSVSFWRNGLMPFSSPCYMDGSLHVEAHIMAAYFFKTSKGEINTYIQSHISCHLCHSPSAKSESQILLSLKERKRHRLWIKECICHVTLFSQFPNKCTSDRGDIYVQLLP